MIGPFRGEFRWLSNFVGSSQPVYLAGDARPYPTVEHAYQAAKSFDDVYRDKCAAALTPAKAKQIGKQIKGKERPDWPSVKLDIMTDLVRQKFKDVSLAAKLKLTGDEEIVEINTWNDCYFGQCPLGNGENHLGKILMRVRSELLGAKP